jgi:hypothetical protein
MSDNIEEKLKKNKNVSTPLFIIIFIIITLIIWFLFYKSTQFFSRLNFLNEFINPITIFYILISFVLLMFFIMRFDMIEVFEENHTITFAVIAFISASLLIGSIVSFKNVLNIRSGLEAMSVLNYMKNFGKMISIFLLFGAVVYGILSFSIDNYEISSNLLIPIIVVGILIASFVFYSQKDKFLPEEDTKNYKILRLLKNIILFIPCFLGNILTKILKELRDAPKEAYMLLIIEAIIVTIFVFVKPIKNYIYKLSMQNGIELLREPISLNKNETVGSFDELHEKSSNENNYKYNYSISSWFYLNPDNSKDEFLSIINYGKKPIVEYNQYNNKFRIKMLNGKTIEKNIYKSDEILPQKWNHLVINYNGSTLDIFLNNELVASEPNIVPYMYYDTIVTGTTNLNGKICNVVYFNETLSKSTITYLYEFYRQKNPPILL